jgi:hypothetical protein
VATEERVYDSGPKKPDDAFWLSQGRKMVEESLPAVREAAKALMTGLGVLQAVYVGVLGFGDFLHRGMWGAGEVAFAAPGVLWLVALYECLRVMMTKEYPVNPDSPDDIRRCCERSLRDKQRDLECAFWFLAAGLGAALLMVGARA